MALSDFVYPLLGIPVQLTQIVTSYTPNSNMADLSVGAWNELHESEASQASVFCFDNVFPGKRCFVVSLVCFFLLCLRVAVFLNATRSDRSVPLFAFQGKSGSMAILAFFWDYGINIMQVGVVPAYCVRYCFYTKSYLDRFRSVCSGGVINESSSYLMKISCLCCGFYLNRVHDINSSSSGCLRVGGK